MSNHHSAADDCRVSGEGAVPWMFEPHQVAGGYAFRAPAARAVSWAADVALPLAGKSTVVAIALA